MLQLTAAKSDSEQLARTLAEEKLSEVEKEKTMIELELKETFTRHKTEISKKESAFNSVSIEPLRLSIIIDKLKGYSHKIDGRFFTISINYC